MANITFNRVGAGSNGAGAYSDNATILLGNYSDTSDASGAFSYYPSPYATAPTQAAGDVWDNAYYNTNIGPAVGNYGWITLIHELGHSIGLEHPGDYNAAPGVSITYAQNASYVEDSRQYTVMSYFDASNPGADHYDNGTQYAATPLLDDITALQRLYGANKTTRLGDTVYGFNSNADRAVYHLTSASDQRVMAIWDAGGYNTIDMSGYATNQLINLNPGAFSSTGALTQNLAIAVGTLIQAAIGGSGNDLFYVNTANDSIDGGGGTNTVVCSSVRANYALDDIGGIVTTRDSNASQGGTDRLANIRYLQFADQTVDVTTLPATAVTLALVADTGRSATDGITNDAAVQGVADAGATVTILDGTRSLGSARADGSGRFSFTPAGLADGSVTLTASETDALGHTVVSAPLAFTLDTVAPLVAITSMGGPTTDPHQVVTGQTNPAEAGDAITVFDGAAALATSVVQADGGWTAAVTLTGQGVHSLTAAAIDAAGNTGVSTGVAYTLVPSISSPDPIFDSGLYLAQNPDVAAAGIDPHHHYLTYGWHEGRNPEALFDMNYYLDQNPDVRAAGINPLTHFETNGWREGRDPSLLFSDSGYLAANPDVQAAGIDPLLHYILYGQAEGRMAFLSGGVAAADPLVTAASYDPQLGATEIPTGTAAAQQAAWSYATSGWQKGLNPDTLFDTNYYLSHNPDVAAARMSPLLHYEEYGWHEGRDPSAQFSTHKYLDAYADVKNAGLDPLLHYVVFGQGEGRTAFTA